MSVPRCDVSVPLNAIAWALWGLAILAVVLLWFWHPHALIVTAVLLGVAGATVHIRGFVTQLEYREAAAFELGRDTVRLLNSR